MRRSRGNGRPLFGLLGLGRLGRLLAPRLARFGPVWAHDPDPAAPTPRGVRRAGRDEAATARVLLLAVPIRSMQGLLEAIAGEIVEPCLVADTASVKSLPARWMLEALPPRVEILATHPLFGPDSARSGWSGRKVVLCPVRLRHRRCVERFVRRLGLRPLWRDPEEHDREVADTQALVHFLGRALEALGAGPRDLDTRGYRRLLEIAGDTSRDTRVLFEDMQRFNPHAAAARRRLLDALERLDAGLSGPLP